MTLHTQERHRLRNRPEKTLGFPSQAILGSETSTTTEKLETITKNSYHQERRNLISKITTLLGFMSSFKLKAKDIQRDRKLWPIQRKGEKSNRNYPWKKTWWLIYCTGGFETTVLKMPWVKWWVNKMKKYWLREKTKEISDKDRNWNVNI